MKEQPEQNQDFRRPLHRATLSHAQLHALIDDITQLCRVVAILPRSEGMIEPIACDSPEAGKNMLLSGQIRALQIRYIFEGQEWWDTIISDGMGAFQVTRIEQFQG